MRPSAVQQQRAAAALILGVISVDGFALAGSGAIREHALIDRPTQDVDLFTIEAASDRFAAAVERAIAVLTEHGYEVVLARSAAQFARLAVTGNDEYRFEVDFGVDWRAHEPVWLGVGPVLALEDAVANKVGALYSRAAARDYLDVDAIRQSGRFSDKQLLQLATEHDPGFDPLTFAEQLGHVGDLRPPLLAEYGVSPDELPALQQRLLNWRSQILERHPAEPADATGTWETVEPPPHNRRHQSPPPPAGPHADMPM